MVWRSNAAWLLHGMHNLLGVSFIRQWSHKPRSGIYMRVAGGCSSGVPAEQAPHLQRKLDPAAFAKLCLGKDGVEQPLKASCASRVPGCVGS